MSACETTTGLGPPLAARISSTIKDAKRSLCSASKHRFSRRHSSMSSGNLWHFLEDRESCEGKRKRAEKALSGGTKEQQRHSLNTPSIALEMAETSLRREPGAHVALPAPGAPPPTYIERMLDKPDTSRKNNNNDNKQRTGTAHAAAPDPSFFCDLPTLSNSSFRRLRLQKLGHTTSSGPATKAHQRHTNHCQPPNKAEGASTLLRNSARRIRTT